MQSWLHRASWVALALSALLYIGLMIADYRYYSVPLVPIDLLALVFYLPWWFGWLPLLGCWLLVRAWAVGGGRWGWRWGCGGLLVVSHLYFFGSMLYDLAAGLNDPDRDSVVRFAPYGYYREILVTLALAPVGVLTWAWKGDAKPAS